MAVFLSKVMKLFTQKGEQSC